MPPASETFIRRGTSRDAPVLRAILNDTFESTWLPELTPAAAQRYRDEDRPSVYIRERGAEFRVAEYDGQVVGFVDWDADFVNALHVHSSHVQRGVGSRLMDLAENEIASAGFPNARLETDTFNSRSRAFYEKRGYREADRYPDIEWNSGLTTLLLVKSLSRAGGLDAGCEHKSE
ncbi:MAG: GNAT family N-acetyltransferase [Phycisphaerales bacterium]|nr:GNAT family N-acetyltransferase [Hyphomonadaceae bacterium]